MKISILLLLLCFIIHAAPIGICQHSYSPEATKDKIESIEFEKIEKDQQGTRVYPANQRAILITKYRYRGIIAYIDKMTPEHPEFRRYLKYDEDNATQIPSTKRFLNPKIIAMREFASSYEKQKAEYDKSPIITIGGKNYRNLKLIKFEWRNMYISHKDVNTTFDADEVTDKEIDLLRGIDGSFKNFTISLIGGRRFWNPKFDGIHRGAIPIRHEKEHEDFPIHKLSDQDQKIIAFWSYGDLAITDVVVKILQVLDEGFHASGFVANLYKRSFFVRTDVKKLPIISFLIKKVINIIKSNHETQQIVERINDDLCYILGNPLNHVDNEIVKAKRMRLRGRYQYVDVRGAKHSERKNITWIE